MRKTGSGKIPRPDSAQNTLGSEIAEFAMILPILFLLLIGIFWFGQAFRIYGTISNAARDGARAAVAPNCSSCGGANDPTQNAWTAIQNDLQAAHINPNLLQQPANPPALCACSSTGNITGCTSTTVPCDTGQTNICVQGVTRSGGTPPKINEGNVQLSSTVSSSTLAAGAGECGISVSFQYPYSFWLPFTSLDKQQVLLRAQAQMRAESQ
jgi:Flp pilus assembly protein TadG